MGVTYDQIKTANMPTSDKALFGDGLWKVPGGVADEDDVLNGFLLCTDPLVTIVGSAGLGRSQPYYQMKISNKTAQVTGMAYYINRGGSVTTATVGLFDTAGNILGSGPANFGGNAGWRKSPFMMPCTIQTGVTYVLGIVGDGDNMPGFGGTNSGDLNVFMVNYPMRSFRRNSVSTFLTAQNFSLNAFANTDARPFLALY